MTEQEPKPTQHDDWVSERDRAQKLGNMINHPGWKEVLAPQLTRQRAGLLDKLLTANLTKAEEFVLVRQSIIAVDSVFDCIKAILAVGEKAAEMLKKEEEEIS